MRSRPGSDVVDGLPVGERPDLDPIPGKVAPRAGPTAVGTDGQMTHVVLGAQANGPVGCREFTRVAPSPWATPMSRPPPPSPIVSPAGKRSRVGGPMRTLPRSASGCETAHRNEPRVHHVVSRSPEAENSTLVGPTGRNPSSLSCSRSQNPTPLSMATASSRPLGCRARRPIPARPGPVVR